MPQNNMIQLFMQYGLNRKYVNDPPEVMKVLVLIADGSEEIEAVVTIDMLRRAQIDVHVASVTESLVVECSRKVKIVADFLLSSLTVLIKVIFNRISRYIA